MPLNQACWCYSLHSTLTAADNPLLGTWKFNPATSKLTGDTITIMSAARGMMRVSAGAASYDIKADGQERPGPFDRTVICKQIDEHTGN